MCSGSWFPYHKTLEISSLFCRVVLTLEAPDGFLQVRVANLWCGKSERGEGTMQRRGCCGYICQEGV